MNKISVDFLKNTNRSFVISMLAKYYPFSDSQLKKYITLLHGWGIENNENIQINSEIAEILYVKKCSFIRTKNILPLDFIIKYCDKLDWYAIRKNDKYVWNLYSVFKLYSNIDDYYFQHINLKSLRFDNEYDLLKLEGILKVINGVYIWQAFSKCETIPWTFYNRYSVTWAIDILKEHESRWDWKSLSKNPSLPWSIKLVSEFSDKWDWKELCNNRNMCWSNEFIIAFKDKLSWHTINNNTMLLFGKLIDWDSELLSNIDERISFHRLSRNINHGKKGILLKYADKWNWEVLSLHYGFTFEEISLFHSYIDWAELSKNIEIRWDVYILKKYSNTLNWSNICSNDAFIWTEDLLRDFETTIDWKVLCSSSSVRWDIELITRYETNINWDVLSENLYIDWNVDLLKKFRNKVNWEGICKNENIVFTEESLKEFEEKIYWKIISFGNRIQLTPKLLDNYCDKLDWEGISENTTIFWDETLLSKFGYKLNWDRLGSLSSLYNHVDISLHTLAYCNKLSYLISYSDLLNVKWSPELIAKYEKYWDWDTLSCNKSINWDSETLIKYKDKLNWQNLICTFKSTELLTVLQSISFFDDYYHVYECDDDMVFYKPSMKGEATLYYNLIHPYINDKVVDDLLYCFDKENW